MIGKKSIFGNYTIKNAKTGKEIVVKVQADKLYRVCDVIYPVNVAAPQEPDPTNKGAVKAYKEAKLKYDQTITAINDKRQAVMNVYKGSQFNDPAIQDEIGELLFNIENV